MARIKMHIPKAKLPFYPPYEVKYRLQNGVSTQASKRSPTRSISERLGLKKTGPYKGKAFMKKEACNQRSKKEKKEHLVLR